MAAKKPNLNLPRIYNEPTQHARSQTFKLIKTNQIRPFLQSALPAKKKDLLAKPTNCQKIDANLQNELRMTFYETRLATKQPSRKFSYMHH